MAPNGDDRGRWVPNGASLQRPRELLIADDRRVQELQRQRRESATGMALAGLAVLFVWLSQAALSLPADGWPAIAFGYLTAAIAAMYGVTAVDCFQRISR
jgi:hypothetical protein